MNSNEFVQLVRSGEEKLRVDDIVINTGEQEVHGKGMLEITRKEIRLKVTINKGERLPEGRTGIYTRRDDWTITGTIEDSLQFKCEHAHFPHNVEISEEIVRCLFSLHPIELIPSGWDALSRKERNDVFRQHQVTTPVHITTEGNDDSDENWDNPTFHATLFEYPILRNWAPEIKGETDLYSFSLKKLDSTQDVRISLTAKPGVSSEGEEADWKRFYAFMNALAFIHGVNTWPYRVEYYRAGKKLVDRVTAAYSLTKTVHSPFTEAAVFFARTREIPWDYPKTIQLATKWFETASPLKEEVEHLLFLFRQAGAKGVHRDISLIAFCVLLENLVRHIFKGLKLQDKARGENPDLIAFESAKKKWLETIQTAIGDDVGEKRVYALIQSAEVFNTKLMFQTIVGHFGLRWENDMENVFTTWREARHPNIHQSQYGTRSEDGIKQSGLAESRIAGAINILTLKLFGYSGLVRYSAFEDGYRQI